MRIIGSGRLVRHRINSINRSEIYGTFCDGDPVVIVPPWLVLEPICAVCLPSVMQPLLPVTMTAPHAVMSPTVATGLPSQVERDDTPEIVLRPHVGQSCTSPSRAVGFIARPPPRHEAVSPGPSLPSTRSDCFSVAKATCQVRLVRYVLLRAAPRTRLHTSGLRAQLW